jgi:carboxyvinyl-carboxyphosphonate phosphorylmutase
LDCTERRQRLRAILQGDRCIFPASVYDGVSARSAEAIGFEAMMLAGSVASAVAVAAPDIGLLTLGELAAQAHRINRAVALPLLVDADHGYGTAMNVRRAVEELETAGVSGLTIEDTLIPAPFGATGDALIPVEEALGKLRAAVAARQDPRLVVAGRTTLALAGLDEVLRRLQAY